MAKPVMFGTGSAPVVATPPEAPKSEGGGWGGAIGQIADAGPKLARKSKKPWPTKDAAVPGVEGKA